MKRMARTLIAGGLVGATALMPTQAAGLNRAAFIDQLKFVSVQARAVPSSTEVKKYAPDPKAFCIQNEWSTNGQPYFVDFTSNGVSFTGASGRAEPSMNLYSLPQSVFKLGAGNVLVFVLDDFSPGVYARAPIDEQLSHGELVTAHLRAIVESTREYTYQPSQSNVDRLVYQRNDGKVRLSLVKIRQSDASITINGSKIAQANPSGADLYREANYLTHGGGSKTNIVVNMSFVLIPCQIAVDYQLSKPFKSKPNQPYSFKDYYTELENLNTAKLSAAAATTFRSNLRTVVATLPDNDDFVTNLQKTLNLSEKNRANAAAVAASGNYGLPFSLAPASRPEVIGVGGMNWNTLTKPAAMTGLTGKLPWSDPADTYTVGEWYTLKKPFLTNGCLMNNCVSTVLNPPANTPPANRYDKFAYSGTSFASPTVAAYLALRIASSPCYKPDGNRFRLSPSAQALSKYSASIPQMPVFKGGAGGILNDKC